MGSPLTFVRARIGAKVLAIAGAAVALTACVGAVGTSQISQVASRGEAIYNQALLPTQEVAKLRDAVARVRVDGLSRVIAVSQKQPEAVAKWSAALAADEGTIDAIHSSYGGRTLPAAERGALDRFWAAWVDYRECRVIGDQLNKQGRAAEFNQLRDTRMTPDTVNATKALDDLTTASAVTAQERLSQAKSAADRALLITMLAMVAGLMTVIVVGLLVARSIVRPLHALRGVLSAVAEGDLTQRAAVDSGDEVGQMATALNSTLGTVHDVILQIESDATKLASYASEVARRGSTEGASEVDGFSDGTTAEHLAQMAENLNAMITIFNLEASPAPVS